MNLNGKTAIITGAAVGIGKAVAIKMATLGAKTVLLDLNPETLEKTRKEVEKINSDVLAFTCDVSNEDEVNQAVSKAKEKFGKIDILVNNAALWRSFNSFLDISVDEWKKFLDINIMGTVYPTRAVLGDMIADNYGRIINVSSVAGVYGNADMVHYSTTKGAINSYTKALAKEVSDKGVLVNAVCPGSVSPAENDDISYVAPSELSFMGRTGSGMENANLICFLASDEASYIAGQCIQIDGCRKKQ